MIEKIYKYLVEKDSKVSTQEIIEKFFHVFNQYPPQMETIVESILKDDSRFVRDEIGEWYIQKKYEKQNLADVVFSIVETEVIPIDSKTEIPVLLGIARVKNMKLISQQIFSLDISDQDFPQLRNKINQLQQNLIVDLVFNRNAEEIYQNLDKTIVISYTPSKVMAIMNYFLRNQIGLELEAETMSLVNLARKIMPGIKIKSIEDIANSLSIVFHSPLDLKNRLNLMAEILSTFLHEFNQLNIRTLTELREFIDRTKTWIDFSSYNFNKDYIKNLPTTPGVYLMKDNQDQIFYVGKAKNLKSRVESYFINRSDMDDKGMSILSRLFDLIYQEVGSELEALLLENKCINEYQPDLNTQIKIHTLDILEYRKTRILILLPGISEEQIVLFLVNGTNTATVIIINNKERPDWQYLNKVIKQIFFNHVQIESNFSLEQIEIIWRWFSVHKKMINFLDVEQCGSLENCMETIKKYFADEKLFSDKIYYI